MNAITLKEVYDRLCEVLESYNHPNESTNGWTEGNRDAFMYENIVQIVSDIETFPHN